MTLRPQAGLPFLALLICLTATARAADAEAVAFPDTTAIAAGAGTEDDPWLIDIDALLAEGFAVIVAPDTTFAVADAEADTIRIAAPRLRVSDVVRRVSETMDDMSRNMGEQTFTMLQRVDFWTRRGDAEKEKRTELTEAWRIHVDEVGEQRSSRLFQREREWKAGELDKDETDTEITREWQEEVAQEMMDMPFSLLAANAYRYEIKERTLIGEHLVFRIGFTPKSAFEPGLEGDVWIDYSDFVIRRMSGRLVGPMPVPLIMKGVPRFAFTLKQVEGNWVTEAIQATILLNSVLPGIPEEIELSVSLDDFVFGPVAEVSR